MNLRILGCSGGIGEGLRTTSFLVDDDILIDAGTGVGDLRLEEMRLLRHVFLTHSHLDHIMSLPPLVDTLFEDLATQSLLVYSQDVTLEALKTHIFNWSIWPDFTALPSAEEPVMRYRPQQLGEVVPLGERQMDMIEVNHVIPGVAYYISDGEHALCFSGDTTSNDSLWTALNEKPHLDLLLIECGFPEANRDLALLAYHYCPSLLAADLRKLKHRPKIAISHFKPGAEEQTMNELQQLLPEFDLFPLKTGDTFQL